MRPHSTVPDLDTFTPADRRILSALIAAPNQRTAATWLFLDERTLRRRLEDLKERLGVETTIQAVALAGIIGAIDPKALPPGCGGVDSGLVCLGP